MFLNVKRSASWGATTSTTTPCSPPWRRSRTTWAATGSPTSTTSARPTAPSRCCATNQDCHDGYGLMEYMGKYAFNSIGSPLQINVTTMATVPELNQMTEFCHCDDVNATNCILPQNSRMTSCVGVGGSLCVVSSGDYRTYTESCYGTSNAVATSSSASGSVGSGSDDSTWAKLNAYLAKNITVTDWSGLNYFLVIFAGQIIPVVLCVVVVCVACLYNINIETDPIKLWVSTSSTSYQQRQHYGEMFNPFYRSEQVIMVPKDGGNIYRSSIIKKAIRLQNVAANVTYTSDKGDEMIALNDICWKATGTGCTVNSITQYFQNSMVHFEFYEKYGLEMEHFALQQLPVLSDHVGRGALHAAEECLEDGDSLPSTNTWVVSLTARRATTRCSSTPWNLAAAKWISEKTGVDVWVYSLTYVYFEQYLTVVDDAYKLIGLALAAIFVITTLYLGNVFYGLMIALTATNLVVLVLGLTQPLDIMLNGLSIMNLIIAAGIAVEFCGHYVRFYAKARGTGDERARDALRQVFTLVIFGITIIGLSVLTLADSRVFKKYYFRMYMLVVLCGVLNGMLLLPVLLSTITDVKGFFFRRGSRKTDLPSAPVTRVD
ncbi:hypothetical protein PF005_g16550 [Phytophthora fragariae]|uniref:NPC1 middle luminal domain-containing protein n=1 Tax=Phytophthora fragariae TaxID=53985 RepID=A0A6A3X8J2_9STRA|nr:hypothetical protein PF009_g17533 [Phytophthora fragariae]KAE9113848.1 hypothetical protein PF010_g9931 [Phytophthora fragariae]KAE9197343.1 hypothetical protein PF005_g16550 [Phytophthora fragariae]